MVWYGDRCVCEDRAGLVAAFRVMDHSLRPALASLLLGWIVERHDPNRLLLHANAVVHQPSGRLLFLAGDSGSGKSTLTRELLATGDQWVLAAEDMAILDPDARILIPFPRPSSLRIDASGPSELPLWRPFGTDGNSKALLPPDRFVTAQQPLADAVVCVLHPTSGAEHPPPSSPEPTGDTTYIFQLTYADDAMLDALRAEGFDKAALKFVSGIALVQVEGALEASDMERLCSLFERHEAFLLRAGVAGSGGAPPIRFGQVPVCREIAGSRAMGLLEPHLKRHRPLPDDPSREVPLFRLVRALHDASFLELAPGGTPRETLDSVGLRERFV